MTTDPARVSRNLRIECTLHDDPRLMVGVREIIRHAAECAGLSEQQQKDFEGAVFEACRESFLLVHGKQVRSPTIKLAAADFPDRLEITIDAGASEESAKPTPTQAVSNSARSDRSGSGVRRETRGGIFYVTLAKSSGAVNSARP
jgi:anti-sigma regulatory factor (Ser/Thr protein kinase)